MYSLVEPYAPVPTCSSTNAFSSSGIDTFIVVTVRIVSMLASFANDSDDLG